MIPAAFSRRIYTWSSFRNAVIDIIAHMEDLRQASRGGRVSRQFAEKIMLAVTQVNGCRYCAYGHTRAALAAGVSDEEIRQLLSGDLGSFPEKEAVALAFAQHYAESACKPDPAARQRMTVYYGSETAKDIQAYMRMITFGNLYGNTIDAWLSRLAGAPAKESSVWSEMGVILGVFFLIPGLLLRKAISLPPFRKEKPVDTTLFLKEK